MKQLHVLLKALPKSDPFLLYPIGVTLSVAVFITLIFLIFYHQLPPKLPLFYSLPWGESQLVAKQQFFLLPAVLTLTAMINTLLATNLHPLQYPLKRMLMGSLVAISLIILITAIKILFIFI